MVYFFKTRCGTYTLYMGRDKFENEELIKYGWPEDVWFHVDDLSSAHVYLRMKPGMKKSEVYVVYTRWKNLKKTPNMVEGQVGYHRPENVRRLKVEKNNPIVRQLEKSRVVDDTIDLYDAQQRRLAEIQRDKKAFAKQQKKEQELARLAAEAEKEAKSYDRLFENDRENMVSVSEQKATADATAAEEY
eukprot:CAMPEP_0117083998 /NCGR_PEP_ID=MMETSP0472-20121206/59128_1 /TAXON_ID=693140 ORGANISM="Tiarina fusus, Strain LIS" /NCGR_SAMPLE_ID=MMETSP0472 /ASSEMBLY_ACC=CAM_ASM_000603 /LENGTH=187 /DNA_ID=CAMNT_0004812827 /DNA_START=61 /DNA_END=621 /DNA_ORIENTATION=+